VEEALVTHPAVALAGVAGRPDARLGEEVVAFVSLRPDASITVTELSEYARQHLAANKYPRQITIVPAMPRHAPDQRRQARPQETPPMGGRQLVPIVRLKTSFSKGTARIALPWCRSARRDPRNFGLALSFIACDVHVVGGYVLAAAGQQASGSGSLIASSHAFWYGILLVCALGWAFGEVPRIGMFIVALIASDLLQSILRGHMSGSNRLMLIILVVGLLVGLYIGRLRGLRHLGEFEFRNRRTGIRTISRWF
jgi:hypothetical protein